MTLNLLEKSILTVAALGAIATCPAKANIGDTILSSRAKYGVEGTRTRFNHQLEYNAAQWNIVEAYNDAGICVYVNYLKRNGYITKSERQEMDHYNLPAYTLNDVGNGWVKENWKTTDTMRNRVSHIWYNGAVTFQVMYDEVKYGNTWFAEIAYNTGEGTKIMKDDIAAADAPQNTEPSSFDHAVKTNI